MSFNQKNMVQNHFKPLQTYIGSSTNNLNHDQQKPSSVKTSPKNSTDTRRLPVEKTPIAVLPHFPSDKNYQDASAMF